MKNENNLYPKLVTVQPISHGHDTMLLNPCEADAFDVISYQPGDIDETEYEK